MKNSILALSGLLAAAGIAAAQAPVAAPAPVPVKIGIIQAEAALEGTKDGQAAAAELQKKLAPKKAALDKKQADIRDLQDKVTRGANTLSPSVLDEMKRDLDKKTKAYNYDLQDAQADAENEQRKVLDGLTAKMRQVIDKYAQENGYALIIDVSNPNSGVAFASNAIDVTQAIIDLYDKTSSAAPVKSVAPSKPAVTPRPPATKPPAAPAPKK